MPLYSEPTLLLRPKPAPFVLCPGCPEAMGGQLPAAQTATPASAAWPSANLGLGYPFILPEPRTALSMWTYNGAAGTDARDVGIYDDQGTRIVSIGTTAAGTNSVLQVFDIADTVLAANTTYYAWMSCANTTAAFFRCVGGTNVGQLAQAGLVQAASVFVLPSSITYAALTTNYLPMFGISFTATY